MKNLKKSKENTKIYAMDIIPSKTSMKEFKEYIKKLPKKYNLSIAKAEHDYIMQIDLGNTTHLVRCYNLEPLMGFIEGVINNDLTRET